MARRKTYVGRGVPTGRLAQQQQTQANPYQGYTGAYGPGTGSPGGPGTGGTVSQALQYGMTPAEGGGGSAYGAVGGGGYGYGGGQTQTTEIGPQTVTDRPWDENLYTQLLGDVERFRTQALPDISAHQAELERQIGVRATAGLGSGPMARAARQQALVPIRAQFGAGAADRYLRQQGMLAQMGQGLLTPYGVRETSGRTDVRTQGPAGANPYQGYGGPVGIRAGYGPRGQFLG